MMRPMLLEFPDDPACSHLDRQYMLGADLLVAPVFTDDGRRGVLRPERPVDDLLTGEPVNGPGWVRQRHGFDSLPLLVRPGSVIAVGSRVDRPDYDDAVGVAFEVFGLADGASTVTELYDDLGQARVRVQVARQGDQLVAEVLDGLEHLTEGWRLQWAAGPFGARTGAVGTAAVGQAELRVSLRGGE